MRTPRPPHPAPDVRDDRDTPLMWARDGGGIWGDLAAGRREIFLRNGLDSWNRLDALTQNSVLAQSRLAAETSGFGPDSLTATGRPS
jgi:hypothetical protein